MTGTDLLLTGATLADARRVDVLVRDGLVARLQPAGSIDAGTTPVIDLQEYLLLPAPAEPHAHLDKAYTADLMTNPSGDLAGAVSAWLHHRPTLSAAAIQERARRAALAYVRHGATALRSHVDIGTDIGLTALQALVEVRQALAEQCELQLVAFASNPLGGPAGAPHRALLAEALALGADLIGACPALDEDPHDCIEACLDLAAQHEAGVDLHVDESLDPDQRTLSTLASTVRRTGFAHPVTASHCVSLAAMPAEVAHRLADEVAAAGIAVVCLPQTNLYLQGRGYPGSPPRGLTAVSLLRSAGVRVAAGGDNLQDPFNCLGRADPLETAALLVLAGHEQPAPAYAAVSGIARDVLGLAEPALAPGAPAELLAIKSTSLRHAIAESPADRVVIHAGRVVSRTQTTSISHPLETVSTLEPLIHQRRPA